MKKMTNVLKVFMIIFTVIIISCKKEKPTTIDVSSVKAGPIPSYNFDWETATYVPSFPANSIPMPWNSGTSAISADLVSDFKSSEGWNLVYNTFSPTTPTSGSATPYFFTLYNVYRGLLRFYVYQPPTAQNSTYINHGLSLYSNGYMSPMLNYEGSDLTDAGLNSPSFTKIYNQPINANGGTWFVFQYEVAYDANISQTSFPSFGLGIDAKYVSVSNLTLNGTQIGKLTGTISTAGTEFTLDGALKTVAHGTITGLGLHDITPAEGQPQSPIMKQLLTFMGGALQGDMKNIYSLITGGSSGTTQQVNMQMNTQIQLAGTSVNGGGLLNLKLALPGQSNSQTADGLIPIYNNVMGLFNISSKPTIYVHRNAYKVYVDSRSDKAVQDHTISFDPNSISLTINPAISSVATIQNVKKEVVCLPISTTNNLSVMSHNGIPESYGMMQAYTNLTAMKLLLVPIIPRMAGMPSGGAYPVAELPANLGVRITFDVVPTNGAPKSTIIKTFLANKVYN